MQENKDYDEFKVGDTVYCAVHGKGTVESCLYPIVVKFNKTVDGRCVRVDYTEDGRLGRGSERTLFFTPPELKPGSVKRPYESKLIGKEVVVIMKNIDTFCGTVVFEDDVRITISDEQGYTDHLIFEKTKIRRIKEVGKNINFK